MPIQVINLPANKRITFSTQHKYFLLLSDGGSPVNCKRRFANGNQEDLDGMKAGFGLTIEGTNQTHFDFTSPTTKNIQLYYGNDKPSYITPNPNTIQVTGTLDGITNPILIGNEVEVKNDAGNPLAVTLGAGATVEISNDIGTPIPVNFVGGALEISNDLGNPIPTNRNFEAEIITSFSSQSTMTNVTQSFITGVARGAFMVQNNDTTNWLRLVPLSADPNMTATPVRGFRVPPNGGTFEFIAQTGGFTLCLENTSVEPNNVFYTYTNAR